MIIALTYVMGNNNFNDRGCDSTVEKFSLKVSWSAQKYIILKNPVKKGH